MWMDGWTDRLTGTITLTVAFCSFPNTTKKGNLLHISTGVLKYNKIGNSFSALLFTSLSLFLPSLFPPLLSCSIHSQTALYSPFCFSPLSLLPMSYWVGHSSAWFRLSSYPHNPSTHSLFIYLHDEGYRILSNVRTLLTNYMASYPRKLSFFHGHCHKNLECHLELTSYHNS